MFCSSYVISFAYKMCITYLAVPVDFVCCHVHHCHDARLSFTSHCFLTTVARSYLLHSQQQHHIIFAQFNMENYMLNVM